MCQCLTPEQFGFVLALFYHHQLALFGFTDDWPLSFRFTPHAPRRPPLGPAGSGRAQTLPAGNCLPPTAQLPKPERARSRRAAPLFQYVTEPSDFYGQNNLFLSTRRRSPVHRSLVAKALNPSLFRHACRMAISSNSCSLLDFPEFAQAVKLWCPRNSPMRKPLPNIFPVSTATMRWSTRAKAHTPNLRHVVQKYRIL